MWEPPEGNRQGAQNMSEQTLLMASELTVGTDQCSGSSEKGQARTKQGAGCQRLPGRVGLQDSRIHRRGYHGDPSNMPPCLLTAVPAVRTRGEEGSPPPLFHLWEDT